VVAKRGFGPVGHPGRIRPERDPRRPEPEPEPTNTAPTANNLTINASGAGTKSGTIVISDIEDAVSALTVIATAPAHGAIVWNSKTNFTYTVTAGSGYNGDDSFTYKVKDSKGLTSATKTVTIKFVVDL